MLEALKEGEPLPERLTFALAVNEEEPEEHAVPEIVRVDEMQFVVVSDGEFDREDVALLDGVIVPHGDAVAEDDTFMEVVESLLRVPTRDSDALTEGVALLLTQLEKVEDTEVLALSDGVAVEHTVAVAQLEGEEEGVAQAVRDSMGDREGLIDGVALPHVEPE